MERQTRQRSAIVKALSDSGRSLSPLEIVGLAQRAVPHLSLSTVYRQLKALQLEGLVAVVELPGQPDRYEMPLTAVQPCPPDCHAHGAHHHDEHGHIARGRAEERHRHHFHCMDCDEVTPIEACPGGVEAIAPEGWEVQRHDITLHGRCAKCLSVAARRAPRRGSAHAHR